MYNCLPCDADSLQGKDGLGPPKATISEFMMKVTGQEDVSLMRVLSPESELPRAGGGGGGQSWMGIPWWGKSLLLADVGLLQKVLALTASARPNYTPLQLWAPAWFSSSFRLLRTPGAAEG